MQQSIITAPITAAMQEDVIQLINEHLKYKSIIQNVIKCTFLSRLFVQFVVHVCMYSLLCVVLSQGGPQ